ncbi:MAG: hypothetical protein ACOY46_17250 [Bacillota bacterium]
MFFRVVTLRYKNKKYKYLRLMKNYRDGKRVKQVELMNLANLSQAPAAKTEIILEELKKLLSFCDSLDLHTGGNARASFLMALEMAFKPKKDCPSPEMEDIFRKENESNMLDTIDKRRFFEMIQNYNEGLQLSSNYILWINKLSDIGQDNLWKGYLINDKGFPIEYFLFNGEDLGWQKFSLFLTDIKKRYDMLSAMVLIPAGFPPFNVNYRENYTEYKVGIFNDHYKWLGLCLVSEDYYSIVSDAPQIDQIYLQDLINLSTSTIHDFKRFNKIINSKLGKDITVNVFLDMFMMTHFFNRVISLKAGVITTAPENKKTEVFLRQFEAANQN